MQELGLHGFVNKFLYVREVLHRVTMHSVTLTVPEFNGSNISLTETQSSILSGRILQAKITETRHITWHNVQYERLNGSAIFMAILNLREN